MAQSQTEVVGRSEGGCKSSSSARLSRVGHPRPLDVRRGFGLLPKREAGGVLGGELNEWALQSLLRSRVEKGRPKRGSSRWGFNKRRTLGCLWRSRPKILKIPKFEARKAIDRSHVKTNNRRNVQKRATVGRSDSRRRRQQTHKNDQQKREKGFNSSDSKEMGRIGRIVSFSRIGTRACGDDLPASASATTRGIQGCDCLHCPSCRSCPARISRFSIFLRGLCRVWPVG